jgi:hypothetical protein
LVIGQATEAANAQAWNNANSASSALHKGHVNHYLFNT